MNEDTMYEERRIEELNVIADFFTKIYNIPKTFKRYANYKTFERELHVYCIEYENNKGAYLKLVVPYKEYDVVDAYVRGVKDLEKIDIMELARVYASQFGA